MRRAARDAARPPHRRRARPPRAPADAARRDRLELQPARATTSRRCSRGSASSSAAARSRRPRPSAARRTGSGSARCSTASPRSSTRASSARATGADGEPRFTHARDDPRVRARAARGARRARGRLRRRHAERYLELAEAAEPELVRAGQATWLERLDEENDNIRAALAWSIESGEVELGLRIAGALVRFWSMRGLMAEGRALADATRSSGADGVPERGARPRRTSPPATRRSGRATTGRRSRSSRRA